MFNTRPRIGLMACGLLCSMEASAATPTSYLEYSSITGTGQTISITRVPVVTSGGGTIYEDVTVDFKVTADGNITYSSSEPTVTASPSVLVSKIATGPYTDTSNASDGFTITGPGVSFGGGFSIYSVSLTSGKTCGTVAAPSIFYSGPVKGTPLAARIAKAKIITDQSSFGIAGSGNCAGGNWPTNGLIGFSQSGGVVTVKSFSVYNGTSTPTDQAMQVDSRNFVP